MLNRPGRSRAKRQRRILWLFILAVLLAFSSLLSTAYVVGAQDSTSSPTDAPTDTPVPSPIDMPTVEPPTYVTALDALPIFVDYDNDNQVNNSFAVSPLAEVSITAPNHNMTGVFLFTSDGTPFTIVWGQDKSVLEALSVAVTYVPNTALLNGNPLPDNSNSGPFPLDEGGFNTDELFVLGKGFLTFPVIINDDTLPIINQANVSSEDLPSDSDSVIIFTPTQARAPFYQIDQTLVNPPDGFAVSDQVITFNLAITNTGSATNTRFPLQDHFSVVQLTFQNAIPAADLVTPGQLGWNDLILTEEQTFINEFLLLILVSSLVVIHFLDKNNT